MARVQADRHHTPLTFCTCVCVRVDNEKRGYDEDDVQWFCVVNIIIFNNYSCVFWCSGTIQREDKQYRKMNSIISPPDDMARIPTSLFCLFCARHRCKWKVPNQLIHKHHVTNHSAANDDWPKLFGWWLCETLTGDCPKQRCETWPPAARNCSIC